MTRPEYAPAMVRRTLAAGAVVAASLACWSGGTADDYAACDLPVVGAVPVPVTPGFTG